MLSSTSSPRLIISLAAASIKRQCAGNLFVKTMQSIPRFLMLFVASCALLTTVTAQNVQHTGNSPDQALRSDARIDPSTFGLGIGIPLGGYPGRGGSSLPINLRYSSKVWRTDYLSTHENQIGFTHTWTRGKFAERSAAGWTSSLDVPRIVYTGKRELYDNMGNAVPDDVDLINGGQDYHVSRIHAHLQDGSSHELRKDDVVRYFDSPSAFAADFTGTFLSTDGSRMRYETSTNTLWLPDGSRYVFDPTMYGSTDGKEEQRASQYIDRNGNLLTISYNSSIDRWQWTDTLGRTLVKPLPETPTEGYMPYSLPGVNGSTITYTLRWRKLSDVLTTTQTLAYVGDYRCVDGQTTESPLSSGPYLFTSESMTFACANLDGSNNPIVFNPVVLSEIELPTGQKYTFTYNIYGEIERMTLPSGGYEKYNHQSVPSLSYAVAPYSQSNRGVVQRWASTGGSVGDGVPWTYSGVHSYSSYGVGTYTATMIAPDGTKSERLMYGENENLGGYGTNGFGNVLAGMTYEERTRNSAGTMLRRKLTQWATPVPQRDPRIEKEVDLILDTGGNALASITTMGYDTNTATFANMNVTATQRYDFTSVAPNTAQTAGVASFTPDPSKLLRREETSYSYGAAYLARNMTSMPVSTLVKDASGNVVAKSEMAYDEAAYPLVWYGSMFDWIDPGTSARGNVTTTKQWVNTSNTWLETHAQYDQVGNVRKSWDARGALSQVEYSNVFHYAYPTKTISAVPDPTNVTGTNTSLEATTDYDYASGRVMSSTDANGKPTTFEYAATDHLTNPNPYRRLTKVNTPGGGYTSYAYGAGLSAGEPAEFVNTRTLVHATLETDSWAFSDGLGRPVRSFVNEAGTWLVSDTQYDSMGRASRVSNPYRSTQGSEGPINPSNRWTTTAYDPLGRVLTVTSPDNAQVSTLYGGVTVTVTDQAGKKRRSETDALGRLMKVTEDPNGLAYETLYTYDVLGNLRKVAQGSQSRYFAYDSLSRLIRAKNPEQGNFTANTDFPARTETYPDSTSNSGWSLAYSYDSNGNLLKRLDARNITTSYIYDNLNRSTRVDYSDGSFTERVYDHTTNGRGRFFYDMQHAPGNTVWEHKKVLAYDDAGRVLTQHQNFYQNGAWGPGYNTSRIYDKAGNVTSQTYPSGHTVNYAYDKAMRLDSSLTAPAFNGNLGDGVWRTYATDMEYDDASRPARETFGTQTTLYHKRQYNLRGQLWDIRLSTGSDIGGPGNGYNPTWNRGALQLSYDADRRLYDNPTNPPATSDNNGNVSEMRHFVPLNELPNSDPNQDWAISRDYYEYDALNRLTTITELQQKKGIVVPDPQAFKQAYTYDRFGNRQINDTLTTLNVNRTQFTIDTATNRISKPGDAQAMLYDNAGNLTKDIYTGTGNRAYDPEGRMTGADGSGYWNRYTYDADGKRTRQVSYNNPETWYVYGMGGELLAEYDALAPAVLAKKEYGYRNGELLITAEAPAYYKIVAKHSGKCLDVDGNSNGGWAQQWTCNAAAMNQQFQLIPTGAGNYRLTSKSSGKSLYVDAALTTDGARVQQWDYLSVDHQQWRVEPVGGGYQKITAKHSAKAMEVDANSQADGARVQQWGYGGGANQQWEIIAAQEGEVRWLVSDHLGTPRIIADKSGSLANIKRHDYLPFGEEVGVGVGGRTTGQGYSGNDGVRQKFTGYERDGETGLDFAQARYYSSAQGRFTSVDPFLSSGTIYDPQTWNRYAYTLNNPLRYVDPLGLYEWDASLGGSASDDELKKRKGGGKIVDRRNAFRNSLAAASEAAGNTSLTERQRADIARSVGAYGKEGDANGVSIATGKTKGDASAAFGTDAKGKPMPIVYNADGTYKTNIKVTFDESIDAGTVAHEGSHVADRIDLVAAIARITPTAPEGQLTTMINNLPENLTRYATEFRAYQVSSSINQLQNRPTEVWNNGWSEADRTNGINKHLRENPIYGVRPEPGKQGERQLTYPK